MRQFYQLFQNWHTVCAKARWSVRQLERQINTMYYDRILASKDKSKVAEEINQLDPKPEYETIIKDPYVLEFLNLKVDSLYIDLVFYNYILKCHVLFDLKIGKLTHQDLGQMQMYVNYYTRELMNEGDNPPIGIVLCADKSDSVVKYTLPEDNKQPLQKERKID
jgi:predicted nuclease of restriction endonuclease-like (RecB) superfamily